MHKIATQLQAQMNEELDLINKQSENALQLAEASFRAVEAIIKKLKDYILDYTFRDEQEEIKFFKEIKPVFQSKLIYYLELYYIEANWPGGNKKAAKAYCLQEMERVQQYFTRNQWFYNYYRTGKTIYDHLFFLRTATALPLLPDYDIDMDARFSTIHSVNLAHIQAFGLIKGYLQRSLNELINGPSLIIPQQDQKDKLFFTGKKAELIELGYALHAVGAINNGNASLKQIMDALQNVFHTDVGYYPAVYHQNIRLRKKERCVFLKALIEFTERRMDDLDEFPGR